MMRCFSVCLCSQEGHLYVTNLGVGGATSAEVRGPRAGDGAGENVHSRFTSPCHRVAATHHGSRTCKQLTAGDVHHYISDRSIQTHS